MSKLKLAEFTIENARELFFFIARWSERMPDHLRFGSDDEFLQYLTSIGYDYNRVIEELVANPFRIIPEYENMLDGATREILVLHSPDSKMSVQSSTTIAGVTIGSQFVDRQASVDGQDYLVKFRKACVERDEAVKSESKEALYSAIATGFSSIDMFLNMWVLVYNQNNPTLPQLNEKRLKGKGYLTLAEKISEWIPIFSGQIHRNPDASIHTLNQRDEFKELLKLRNNASQHPKMDAGIRGVEELAKYINMFNRTIGGLFHTIHAEMNLPVSPLIIRTLCYPEVLVNWD